MNIILNGKARETSARSLEELAREENAPARGVAIALESAVVPRAAWPQTSIKAGDRVEIIRAVQGG